MTLLFVVVVIAIVAGVAVLVVRDQPVLADDPVPGRALDWPPSGGIGAADVDAARFGVGLRGYRMDEVDRVLADVAAALAERDARIADLEAGRSQAVGDPVGVDPDPAPWTRMEESGAAASIGHGAEPAAPAVDDAEDRA